MNTSAHTPSRVRRSALAASVVVLLAGALAACSGGAADTTAGSDPTKDARAASIAVNDCLRAKGYEVSDTPGEFAVPKGANQDQYLKDAEACTKQAAGANAGAVKPAEPKAFADPAAIGECVRAGDFPDFPDDDEAWPSYTPSDDKAFEEQFDECSADVGEHGGASTSEQ